MSAAAAFREGIRRVDGAPALLAGTFAVTLLVSLPLAYALRGMIAAHLGSSLAADAAASGTNYDWWREFSAQATGLGTTFVPTITGFGAVLDNLSDFLDHSRPAATIVGATAPGCSCGPFLPAASSIVSRAARRTRSHGFFGACGMHFWRLLRLGVVAWIAYALPLRLRSRLDLRGRLRACDARRDRRANRASRSALAGYAVFGALLLVCNLVFDYARIRIVVEDRRSAIGGARSRGRGSCGRHPAGVLGFTRSMP